MYGLNGALKNPPVLKNLKTDNGADIIFRKLVLLEGTENLEAGTRFDIIGMNDDAYTINISGDESTVSRHSMRLLHRGLTHGLFGELLEIKELNSVEVTDAGEVTIGNRCDYDFEYRNDGDKVIMVIKEAMVLVNGISMIVNAAGYILPDRSYQVKNLYLYPYANKSLDNIDEAVMAVVVADVQMQVVSALMEAHFLRVGRLTSFRRDAILDLLNKHYPAKVHKMGSCHIDEAVEIFAEHGQLSDLNHKEIRVLLQIVISNYDYYTRLYRGYPKK